jgi:hypothetical protein
MAYLAREAQLPKAVELELVLQGRDPHAHVVMHADQARGVAFSPRRAEPRACDATRTVVVRVAASVKGVVW